MLSNYIFLEIDNWHLDSTTKFITKDIMKKKKIKINNGNINSLEYNNTTVF